jgi:hypothetical protein
MLNFSESGRFVEGTLIENVEKGKGCDIGYALAADSCEGANSVETCTVTALDAITAFAVPNPNCLSQVQSVFSGLAARPVSLGADHSAYFGLAKFYLSQPFQPSTGVKVRICLGIVNDIFRCNCALAGCENAEFQIIASGMFMNGELKLFPFFHNNIHSDGNRIARRACPNEPR